MFKMFVAALKGAGAFRFYFQPIMALIRGFRHGHRDAQENVSPLLTKMFSGNEKLATFKQAFRDILPVTIIALILDLYAQWEIFHYIYVVMTILVIVLIVLIPYFITRDVVNRFKQFKCKNKSLTR
ncbi:hypothetical protein [Thalassotalea atypica]|uniref:hypothetical protein n=1 Tax=Thalassotalea atypica TaxID=2054316 RepID=UPI002573FE6B|nr:hypothetical protein [Thalassotalea atypica]